MNFNRRVYFQQVKPPAYFFPLVLVLGLVIFAILAIFGFLIGIVVGVAIIVFGIARFFSSFGKKKVKTVEENGRTTIILDRQDYEVIERKREP